MVGWTHGTEPPERLRADTTVITDGGFETWLLFQNSIDLPGFAAYPLVANQPGRQLLLDYYRDFVDIATQHEMGLELDAPTWRAN